ncbi:MAG: ATP-binding protein [Bellilinea sp.]
MSELQKDKLPFKPRARLLLLLGDQLIRDPGIAVFELVKNAYDADSPSVTVTMSHITDPSRGKIIVDDAGTGMDYSTVTDIWLEPGTDYRVEQKEGIQRTPRYGRLPLGEKGVGRFAAHKLGNHIKMVTRKQAYPEVVVEIRWDEFLDHKYLEDVRILVEEREPKVFTGDSSGTRIEITGLRNVWDRRLVRELARDVNSICSPFSGHGDFIPELILTDHKEWLAGLLDVERVLEFSLFRATGDIVGNKVTYVYEFIPFPTMSRVEPRRSSNDTSKDSRIKIPDPDAEILVKEVGPMHFDLYIFDRDPGILALGVSDKKGLKEFLDQSGGIRVYRDGIRVYDYGEPGNDWLNLGGRRVNIPTRRLSNNQVIGAVSLDLAQSVNIKEEGKGLIEKTNREGFVENAAFRAFRDAIVIFIKQIESERNIDKTRIRNAYSGKTVKEPLLDDLTNLRTLVEKKGLTKDLGPFIDRIEADFTLIRDRFLTSASAGLSLTVVIHEVEKGIDELIHAVEEDQASPRVKQLAKHIADLVEGFGALIRRSGMSKEKASSIIKAAVFNTELRIKIHKIDLAPNLDPGDFEAKISRRLTISTLMNLIDNSIWWLDNKWGDVSGKKRIYIGTSRELDTGPAIIVADNGPGFMDPPEYLIEPFISRKPDGMGLGLYIANQVMAAQGGKLLFPQPGDVSLPKAFNGAVVALVFQEGDKKK